MKCMKCLRTYTGVDYCTVCSNPSEGYWQMLREQPPCWSECTKTWCKEYKECANPDDCKSGSMFENAPPAPSQRLWLWKNFVDGKPQYLAFDNPYPTYGGGDPMTLGEPCGYAIVMDSTPGRTDVSEADVLAAIKRASERAEPIAWVKSSEWNDARTKRQSFNGWRQNHGDCDMAIYAYPKAAASEIRQAPEPQSKSQAKRFAAQQGETPRTDAVKAAVEDNSFGLAYSTLLHKMVGALSDHARTLERELAVLDKLYKESCEGHYAAGQSKAAAVLAGERSLAALKRIVDGVPAFSEGGGLHIDHHRADGEYIGTENVDPLAVIQSMVGVAMEAIDAARSQEGK